MIGFVESDGSISVDGSKMNDTGVLSVRSPLKVIRQANYVSTDIKDKAKTILDFLEAHKYAVH